MVNMIDVEAVLQEAGYRCKIAGYDPGVLLFEDDSILGFATLFESAADLLAQWREKQNTFIARTAAALRHSSTKSWNCYAVYLCSSPADDGLKPQLSDLEENLSLTRKLVADGLATSRDIQRALLPILPIQNQTSTSSIHSAGLGARLDSWPKAALLALEGDATATELIEILLDAHQ